MGISAPAELAWETHTVSEDRNLRESHPLSRSGQILSKGRLMSLETLPLPLPTSPSTPSWGAIPGDPQAWTHTPSLPPVQEVDPDIPSPHFPILLPSTPPNPTSGYPPSHRMEGNTDTHPRGRQLVRAETVTEREGEREMVEMPAQQKQTEARRDGERSRDG